MAAQLRSLSLPQLHNVRGQRGMATHSCNGDAGLFSLPSTPSTSASSRATPSSLHNSTGWTFQQTHERPLSSSRESWKSALSGRTSTSHGFGTCVFGNTTVDIYRSRQRGVPPSSGRSSNEACLRPLHSIVIDSETRPTIQRPDEELLHCVRTDIVLGDGDSIEYIYDTIQEGEDVNQRSSRGVTPLALSAAAGSGSLVALLLEKRADATIASVDRSETPLHYAACIGHRLVCRLLLTSDGAEGTLQATSAVGWSPLHLAVVAGHEDVVQMLLRAKALPDTPSTVDGNHTSTHLAAMSGHSTVLELLLDYDGDANSLDSLGRTPLHFSAKRADAASVALLLRCHADPSRRGGDGHKTPSELIPESMGMDSDRVHKLFSAYMRHAPAPPRTDARFDLPGGHDILSAYSGDVPWGLPSGSKSTSVACCPKVIEWPGDDENSVWL